MPRVRPERHDAPAALPLACVVAAIFVTPWLANAWSAATALAVCAALTHRRRGMTIIFLSFAAGVAVTAGETTLREREREALGRFDSAAFVRIEAPLTREWSHHGGSFVLRTDSFIANGIRVGQPLLLYARFEPPPPAMEQALSAEGFLRRNERGAYTLTIKSSRLLAYRGELPSWSPQRWNRSLLHRLRSLPPDKPEATALAAALALGRSEQLTEELRESFRRAGTYHLLVFSGLQIAVAAGALAWLLRWLGLPRLADWLLLGFAVLAPLFIGTTPSVCRASSGIGLYAFARILRRPTSVENLWCLSALLRLLISPNELSDPSFQLTYAGSGALLFIAKAFQRHRWIAAAVGAELAITPLTLFHFHQFAAGGSLLTLLLTPVIFAMLIASAVLFAFPTEPMIVPLDLFHRLCLAVNSFGGLTSGFHAAPPPAVLATGALLATVAVALLTARRRAIAVSLAFALPLAGALIRGWPRPTPSPRLTLLDVGQGDAILVRNGGFAMLVDGGGRHFDSRFGESQLLPLLVDRGVRRLDVVVLTHAHPDHCGGLPAVIEHLDTGELWISPRRFTGRCAQELLAASAARRTPIRLLGESERLALPGLHATAFRADHYFKRAAENNTSLILRLQAGPRRILLTGDIEREAERSLLDRVSPIDVLKVAHHGSRSSTTPEFLDRVRPRLALISCGRDNQFGHPHPTVIEALRGRGISVRRTDRNGTVDIVFRDGQMIARTEFDSFR